MLAKYAYFLYRLTLIIFNFFSIIGFDIFVCHCSDNNLMMHCNTLTKVRHAIQEAARGMMSEEVDHRTLCNDIITAARDFTHRNRYAQIPATVEV